MDLKGIVAIAGQPGLFKTISQLKNGLVVESIETQKRMRTYPTDKISALEEIAIYTDSEDKPLNAILKAIREKENGGPSLDPNSTSETLKAYFAEILPEYDRNRVYVSHMKKVILWYNLLQKANLLNDTEEETQGAQVQETETSDNTEANTNSESE